MQLPTLDGLVLGVGLLVNDRSAARGALGCGLGRRGRLGRLSAIGLLTVSLGAVSRAPLIAIGVSLILLLFPVPGYCFGMEGYLRIGYGCKTEILKEGLARFKVFLNRAPFETTLTFSLIPARHC